MACVGGTHSGRKHDHSVGHGKGVGKILVVPFRQNECEATEAAPEARASAAVLWITAVGRQLTSLKPSGLRSLRRQRVLRGGSATVPPVQAGGTAWQSSATRYPLAHDVPAPRPGIRT